MMGHTNRHYHFYFRLLSKRAHLYTEMIPASQIVAHYENGNDIALDELLRTTDNAHPVVLQLGGRDPDTVARAAQIGADWGYNGVNLNCGCPSNAVSGRSGGAALMLDPELVARIVEKTSMALQGRDCELSVKHRLGVAEASTYNAIEDASKDDSEAFDSCVRFVRAITLNGAVKKLHAHGRIALLGDFESSTASLWVPGTDHAEGETEKVNHQRQQQHVKTRARRATILNRSVPPLRPQVVNQLAVAFPHLNFVTNGGIDSFANVQERLETSPSNVVGAMVGRAVINHPCAFSQADRLWGDETIGTSLTRMEVLTQFAEYCDHEEKRLQEHQGVSEILRRRLVAVPFTLFAGERGSDAFQRRVRKLASRSYRHSARSMLLAAMKDVPVETLQKPVSDYTLDNLDSYIEFRRRSGPLQRSIL
jgi:tRNA-dihydrouridine synthase A